MIVFLSRKWLFLFLIFPIFFILKYFKIISPFRIYANLLKWQEKKTNKKNKKLFPILYKLTLCLAISALIFAIAEPSIYRTKNVYKDVGASIMFLLDVSPSMAVKDIEGSSRFMVAKNIIKDLLATMEGRSAGLAIFAKTAALILVPTIDFSTFLSRLDLLELGELQDGTNINSSLAIAVANMKDGIQFANLVLLTDGEHNNAQLIEKPILKALALKSVKLNIIKLGVEGYADIEYFDRENQKEYSGSYYTKTFDADLKGLASSLDGSFIKIESLKDIKNIYHLLNLYSQKESTPYIETEKIELNFYFVLFAIIMAGISWCIARLLMSII